MKSILRADARSVCVCFEFLHTWEKCVLHPNKAARVSVHDSWANASLPVSIVCTLTGVTGPVSVSAERQKRWEGLKGQRESGKEKLYEQEYREMKIYLHVPLNKA